VLKYYYCSNGDKDNKVSTYRYIILFYFFDIELNTGVQLQKYE